MRFEGQTVATPAGCMVAGSELRTGYYDPDAFGWSHSYTHQVECKTSRRDFLKDRAKWHRQAYHSDYSIGDYRWYLTLPGVINSQDELDGWGWVVLLNKAIHFRAPSKRFDVTNRGRHLEQCLLMTICRMYAAEAETGTGIHDIGKYRLSVEPWRGPRMRERTSKGATVDRGAGAPMAAAGPD